MSYSLSDTQEYVVTIMARQLREKGYTLMTHTGTHLGLSQLNTTLRGCSLFIGVVTTRSNEYSRVVQEYNQACAWKIPALLLYEYNAALYENLLNHPDIIVFDKYNPDPTLQQVRDRIAWARSPDTKSDDTGAWLLGGAALLALIALLSSKK